MTMLTLLVNSKRKTHNINTNKGVNKMSSDIIKLIIEIIVLICCYLVGRYATGNTVVKSTISDVTDKINLIITYADKYVAWARQFLQDKTGSEKMDEVVSQLAIIAEKNDIDMSETEIRAIAQKAYDTMKAGEAAAANPTTVVAPVVNADAVKESIKEVITTATTTSNDTSESNTDTIFI